MNAISNATAVEILLVEDNPGDARLTEEAFKDSRLLNSMHRVSDGVEALGYLRQEGQYATAARPDIILLDLNMPRKDGREVLAEIKDDPDLKSIPVVVLTTSDADTDVTKSYELHANCYITKPVDLEKFMNIVQRIEDFWLAIVRLPRQAA
jgi:CheY-like chemotaxis protein